MQPPFLLFRSSDYCVRTSHVLDQGDSLIIQRRHLAARGTRVQILAPRIPVIDYTFQMELMCILAVQFHDRAAETLGVFAKTPIVSVLTECAFISSQVTAVFGLGTRWCVERKEAEEFGNDVFV